MKTIKELLSEVEMNMLFDLKYVSILKKETFRDIISALIEIIKLQSEALDSLNTGIESYDSEMEHQGGSSPGNYKEAQQRSVKTQVNVTELLQNIVRTK